MGPRHQAKTILIDFQRIVRIADFGCTFLNYGKKCLHHYGEEQYCLKTCGTWPYQAPEVLANEGKALVDRRKYDIAMKDGWGFVVWEIL
jgi:serine/threonine protein kinase